jgi:hypothetical protein
MTARLSGHTTDIHGQVYELRILPGGDVRVSRGEHGQTVRHSDLSRHGWNSLADAGRMIEAKISGRL